MSLSNGKKNGAYYRIGLPDEKLDSVYERCVNNMEEFKVSNVDLQRTKKESKVSGFIKYGVAVVAVCAMVGAGLYGIKYYSGHLTTKKDVSKETESEEDFIFGLYTDSEMFHDDSEDREYDSIISYYTENEADYKSQYELIAGEWNTYKTDNALKESTKACYDSNGNLKDGYEIKKICSNSSDKVIEVIGKDFITIKGEQTRNNSSKKRRITTNKRFISANEKYFSYDHVYFVQGNTLVRITCDDSLSVCFDKTFYYDKIELEKGGIKIFANTGEDVPEAGKTVTTRFYDSNMKKLQGVICLRNNGKIVEKLEDVKYYTIYDRNKDKKNVTFLYRDEDNVLWQIKNVKISLDKNTTVDLKKLEVEKNYRKEKLVSKVNTIDVEYDGYISGPDKMFVTVDDGFEVYKQSNDIILMTPEEYLDYKEKKMKELHNKLNEK